MELFPRLQLGFFNGWLLAAIFYLVFGILLLIFPRPVVARLYDRTGQGGRQVTARRLLAVPLFLGWLALVALSPLKRGETVFVIGLAVWALGLLGFVSALLSYRNTPLDQPVTSGLYRVSRHPQQLTLSLSFLGIPIAIGSWLALVLICIGFIGAHFKIVAEERACLEQYGESYRDYTKRVARYFLFF